LNPSDRHVIADTVIDLKLSSTGATRRRSNPPQRHTIADIVIDLRGGCRPGHPETAAISM